MHQIIDAEKRVLDTEFSLKDLLHLPAAKGAYAVIGLCRTGQNTLGQLRFFLTWQLCRPAGLTPGGNGFYATVSIRITPALDKVLAAPQHLHDRLCLAPLQRQGHGPVSITLFGMEFTPCFCLQLLQIAGIPFPDVHDTPFVFQEVCHTKKDGARPK